MKEATVWIKNPLAIYAKNSKGGVVIKGQEIIELVGAGKSTLSKIDEIYDASDSVVLPGLSIPITTSTKHLLEPIQRP